MKKISYFLAHVHPDRRWITASLIYLSLYTVTVAMLAYVPSGHQFSILVWLPAGVSIAAMVRLGYGGLLVPLLGAVAVSFYEQQPYIRHILLDSLGEAGEAVFCYWILRYAKFSPRFERMEDVWWLLFAACFSTALWANIGLIAHDFSVYGSWEHYSQAWMDRWYGHALGVLLVAPLLLSWTDKQEIYQRADAPSLQLELGLYVLALVCAGVAFFDFGVDLQLLSQQRTLIVVPLLVWATTRFPLREATTAVFLMNMMALVAIYTPVTVQAALSYGQVFFFLSLLPLMGLSISASVASNKRAMYDLRESNARLSTLIENLPDGVFFKDGEGRLLVVNGTGLSLLGIHNTPWQGKTYRDLAHEFPERRELYAQLEETDEIAYQVGTLYVYEKEKSSPGGNAGSFEVRKLPRFNVDGTRAGLLVVVREVTDAKRAQAALESTKNRLRDLVVVQQTVLDTLPAQVALLDQHGDLIVVNRNWREYFAQHGDLISEVGVGSSYLQACLHHMGLPVSMSQRMVAGIKRVLHGHAGQFVFEYHTGAAKERLWYKMMVVPLVTGSGEHGAVVMNTDITQFHQTEELLHQREQEFRALAEHSPDLVARYDTAGTLTYANPAHRILDMPRLRDIVGKPVETIWGDDIGGQWKHAMREIVHRGSPMEQVYCKWQGQEGERVFHVFMVPEFLRGSKRISSVLAVARDITVTHNSEQRLRESHERLREFAAETEMVREDEKRHLARELHDELGQLLTALRMEIGMIKLRYSEHVPELSAETDIMLELMDRTIQGVREIIADLRPNVLDMGIVAALEWLSHDFTRLYGIPCHFTTEGEHIELDITRATILFRIVQESLTNIVRHAAASRVDIRLVEDGDNLRLLVQDNGCGMEDVSVTARQTFGLTGMSERAIALGGVLDILSERSKGTSIVVNIPLHKAIN